ncbi:histidinol-phosphate aminotransferase 1 [Thiosulfatimonas sediminis]|uniref:Histidinol-phosphate aminotransferase n=1 Tax=Thiosulfatimonas sediminis TaxID=2675054 RepID=A0A6F8PX26_9GAMM|nr:histidinol-phosphate transaminase [Thiosulfatimonas sediminis]BBP46520.1 histidinol-phosphate aminotransferase 1 [Thiosulfatimonas sediminis]
MSQYWSRLVHSLTPYVPGEQPKVDNLIKLNTNENPYPPSPQVLQAIAEQNNEKLRLYPDPNSDLLKQAIANYHGLNSTQVFVGNGSDEVLAHAFQALLKQDAPLLFPDITYSFYPVYCGLYGIEYNNVPLNAEFAIEVEDYQQKCGGIIFPNPNAPTGRLLPLSAIKQLLEMHPNRVVLVDEAYIDFGGESAICLVNEYPNLLVSQTLSKSRSLAGMRVGFAVGQAHLIDALERVKNSFNSYPIDRLALYGATASFADEEYFQDACQKIINTRETLTAAMTDMGFKVIPSAANFVFATHPQKSAEELALALRERKIIVRYFNKPRIDQYLRITIGTDAENQALINALKTLTANTTSAA